MTREEIIKGVKGCVGMYYGFRCGECPYGPYSSDCVENLHRDVERLMEAQTPRVMTLKEVQALQDNDVVWLEDYDKVSVISAIVNHVWKSLPNMVSFTAMPMREVKANMLWYSVKWRCWTSRPTDKQREATPWEVAP